MVWGRSVVVAEYRLIQKLEALIAGKPQVGLVDIVFDLGLLKTIYGTDLPRCFAVYGTVRILASLVAEQQGLPEVAEADLASAERALVRARQIAKEPEYAPVYSSLEARGLHPWT